MTLQTTSDTRHKAECLVPKRPWALSLIPIDQIHRLNTVSDGKAEAWDSAYSEDPQTWKTRYTTEIADRQIGRGIRRASIVNTQMWAEADNFIRQMGRAFCTCCTSYRSWNPNVNNTRNKGQRFQRRFCDPRTFLRMCILWPAASKWCGRSCVCVYVH